MMRFLPILFSALLLGSCARSYYFVPAAEQNANTEVMQYNGIPYIRSTMEKMEVSTLVTARGTQTIGVDLLCYNDSDTPIEIDPARLRVTGFDAMGVTAPFKVFSAEQFIRRRNTRNAIIGGVVLVASIGAAIASAEGAAAGGNNFDANLFFWSLSAVPPLFFNGSGAEPFVPNDGLARPHTLMPGAAYRGMVMVKGKADFQERLEITMPVNGMPHRFDYARRTRRY